MALYSDSLSVGEFGLGLEGFGLGVHIIPCLCVMFDVSYGYSTCLFGFYIHTCTIT